MFEIFKVRSWLVTQYTHPAWASFHAVISSALVAGKPISKVYIITAIYICICTILQLRLWLALLAFFCGLAVGQTKSSHRQRRHQNAKPTLFSFSLSLSFSSFALLRFYLYLFLSHYYFGPWVAFYLFFTSYNLCSQMFFVFAAWREQEKSIWNYLSVDFWQFRVKFLAVSRQLASCRRRLRCNALISASCDQLCQPC